MDTKKLRSWWFHRQGLDGRPRGESASKVLGETGSARSTGGAAPYLTLFSRGRPDQQRYRYCVWKPNQLKNFKMDAAVQVATELAGAWHLLSTGWRLSGVNSRRLVAHGFDILDV
jgi:hypothetical protein